MVESEGTAGRPKRQAPPMPGDACENLCEFYRAFPLETCVRRRVAYDSAAPSWSLESARPCEPGDACESLTAYFFEHVKGELRKVRERRASLRGRAAVWKAEQERAADGVVCLLGASPLSTCVHGNNCNGGAGGQGERAFPVGSYLGEVERLTSAARGRRAANLEARAAEIRAERARGPDGELVATVKVKRRVLNPRTARRVLQEVERPAAEVQERRARWYEGRAHGQRGRFGSLAHCGEGVVAVRCVCGDERPSVLGCDVRRLCVRCRDASASERRERFARARGKLLERSYRLGHMRRLRRHGRYTEKHMTLTIPDQWIAGEGAVAWRVAVLFGAWRSFSQRMVRHFREQKERVTYFRGFEWTAGADGRGHPHFHVWLWCPWVSVELLRRWWALALHEQGVLVFGCGDARLEATGPGGRARRNSWPVSSPVVLDVREVKVRRARAQFEIIKGGRAIKVERPRLVVEAVAPGGGVDVVGYVEGWVLQEVDTNGRPVPPEVLAELYEALECRRQTQASAGFLALGERECSCPACGLLGGFSAEIVPWWDLELDGKRRALGMGGGGVGRVQRNGRGLVCEKRVRLGTGRSCTSWGRLRPWRSLVSCKLASARRVRSSSSSTRPRWSTRSSRRRAALARAS